MALTNLHNGHVVPWHFDSPEFTYHGQEWRLCGARKGADKSLDASVYFLRRVADGYLREITHKELVKLLRNEAKENKTALGPEIVKP